jgi:SSS family solute:Na+ symporter
VTGGSDAVTVTQKYQLAVIFGGMITAFCLLVMKLPAGLTFKDTFALAGGFQKLKAVNFSTDVHERYTFWSGLLGGTFLMLSYFGTDQSQVQRYISGSSLRESRLGLMFNAVCKIPMQFCILLLGVLIFVFYQFERPPLFFNPDSSRFISENGIGQKLQVTNRILILRTTKRASNSKLGLRPGMMTIRPRPLLLSRRIDQPSTQRAGAGRRGGGFASLPFKCDGE